MKWKTFLHQSPDLLLALSIGAFALWFSHFDNFSSLRIIFGFIFVFLASGYAATRFLPINASIPERIITASLVSLLLTYPAAVITVAAEGQSPQAIFGRHITNSLSALFLCSLVLIIWTKARKTKMPRLGQFPKMLLVPLMIYTLLTFVSLNRADVFGDEYDLGYQSYNLVDGIVAGRKAYLISMSQHPPLAIDIKHFTMNILQPQGLDALSDWQFRVSEGVVGLLVVIVVYALTREIYSEKTATVAAMLASANNYLVWMGRTLHREMYLTFFMSASIFFFFRFSKTKQQIYMWLTGIAIGAGLLTKEAGLIMVSVFFVIAIFGYLVRSEAIRMLAVAFVIFFPVILFNLVAYLRYGYADVFFSNLLGSPHPLSTPRESSILLNITSIPSYLIDIYSPLLSLAFVGCLIRSLFRKKKKEEQALLIWVVIAMLFFSFSAVRAYYFLFLTVPLVLFLAREIENVPKVFMLLGVLLLVVYSSFYSYNTNINRSFSRIADIGGIDGAMIIKHSLNIHFSLAARSWVEEVGYKRLQKRLDETVQRGDCLITSASMDSLAIRRYLGQRDLVKEHYLGPNYPSRYPKCPTETDFIVGSVYFISNKREGFGQLNEIITDHLGNERFYIYVLEKGRVV